MSLNFVFQENNLVNCSNCNNVMHYIDYLSHSELCNNTLSRNDEDENDDEDEFLYSRLVPDINNNILLSILS